MDLIPHGVLIASSQEIFIWEFSANLIIDESGVTIPGGIGMHVFITAK